MSEDWDFGACSERADDRLLARASVDVDVVISGRHLSGGSHLPLADRLHGPSRLGLRVHPLQWRDANIVAVEAIPPDIARDAGSVRQTVTLVRAHAEGVAIEVVAPNLARRALGGRDYAIR